MTIPNFGKAELMSFSCGGCFYRHNKLRHCEEPKDYGVTLQLHVGTGNDLDATVVLTETAVVRCDVLDLEMRGGMGKFTNVEGLLRGCTSVLKNAAGIFTDGDNDTGDGQQSGIHMFMSKVDSLIENCRLQKTSFSIEIEDPLGLSLMEKSKVMKWKRSQEQEDELGLTAAITTCGDIECKIEKPSIVVGTTDLNPDRDAKKYLKAAEAMAAEYTKQYDFHETKVEGEEIISGIDDNRPEFRIEDAISAYGGCD